MQAILHENSFDPRPLGILLPEDRYPFNVLGIDPGGVHPTGFAFLLFTRPDAALAVTCQAKFGVPMPIPASGGREERQRNFRSVQEVIQHVYRAFEHAAQDELRVLFWIDSHLATEQMYSKPAHPQTGNLLAELAGQLRQEMARWFPLESDAQYKACREKDCWRQLIGAERVKADLAEDMAVAACEKWFGGDWKKIPHAAEATCIALWHAVQLSRQATLAEKPEELQEAVGKKRRKKGDLPGHLKGRIAND